MSPCLRRTTITFEQRFGDPATCVKILRRYGTPEFEPCFREYYAQCENISVDYAVLEPRSAKGEHKSHLYCLPAEFTWNDLGSWASLYEYQVETRLRGDGDGNVSESDGHLSIDAQNNYAYSPKKFVALVGVTDLARKVLDYWRKRLGL